MARVEEVARETVRSVGRHLRIERRWGLPWFVGRDLVCCVGAFTGHVGVEFWRGATLAPHHALLEGTGKNLRHVKLRSVREAGSPAFLRLVQDAVRLDAESDPRPR
jgi:hypothetical protein